MLQYIYDCLSITDSDFSANDDEESLEEESDDDYNGEDSDSDFGSSKKSTKKGKSAHQGKVVTKPAVTAKCKPTTKTTKPGRQSAANL